MESPEVLKKELVEITGVNYKEEVEFRGGDTDKEKFMWNFHGSCFLAMEFPCVKWCCSTILRNLQGRSFAFSGISMGKVTINLKIPGVLSKKVFSQYL